jgi:hypothetical protein
MKQPWNNLRHATKQMEVKVKVKVKVKVILRQTVSRPVGLGVR